MSDYTLLRLGWSWSSGLAVQVSTAAVILSVSLIAFLAFSWRRWLRRGWSSKYDTVEVEIKLGNVGHVKLKPNTKDVQIAHQIWTELMTRKAAIPFDADHDVIAEIYDSWHQLFQRIRVLVSDVPADLLRKEESTRELVNIATRTLNDGLRPHLTRWQAQFRHWMRHRDPDELKKRSPQEVQRDFPRYGDLAADLKKVNEQLREYAGALQKIARG